MEEKTMNNQAEQTEILSLEDERTLKLNEIVNNIVIEYKKRGSITSETLLDKLEKIQATPQEMEEIYKTIDDTFSPFGNLFLVLFVSMTCCS